MAKQKVLIAEDVKLISQPLVWALEAEGFETKVARDGASCLDLARTFLPDILVLDLMMPKVHGIDVLRQLRDDPKTSHIAVLVNAAKDFKTEIDFVTELGVIDILIKPVDPSHLIACIRRHLSDTTGPPAAQKDRAGVSDRTEKEERFDPQLDTSRGCVTFWGTRGSIPVSGPQYVRHGGDTSCLQIDVGDEVIIFDAGSGIRNLGASLVSDGQEHRKIHLFITHTHWDHIQGFPFFVPAYLPGNDVTIYAAHGFSKDLDAIFRGQLDSDYFPVQLTDMQADLHFAYLSDEPLKIGEASITWEFAQHPGATVRYRIETSGKSIAYVPDNEFLKGYMGPPRSDRHRIRYCFHLPSFHRFSSRRGHPHPRSTVHLRRICPKGRMGPFFRPQCMSHGQIGESPAVGSDPS